jgi:hypothetical protein
MDLHGLRGRHSVERAATPPGHCAQQAHRHCIRPHQDVRASGHLAKHALKDDVRAALSTGVYQDAAW